MTVYQETSEPDAEATNRLAKRCHALYRQVVSASGYTTTNKSLLKDWDRLSQKNQVFMTTVASAIVREMWAKKELPVHPLRKYPFPIQQGPGVSWAIAARAYEIYSAKYGTQQSLERLAERGGFGMQEIEGFLIEAEKRDLEFRALARERKNKVLEKVAKAAMCFDSWADKDSLESASGFQKLREALAEWKSISLPMDYKGGPLPQ